MLRTKAGNGEKIECKQEQGHTIIPADVLDTKKILIQVFSSLCDITGEKIGIIVYGGFLSFYSGNRVGWVRDFIVQLRGHPGFDLMSKTRMQGVALEILQILSVKRTLSVTLHHVYGRKSLNVSMQWLSHWTEIFRTKIAV